ncbi:MULTISPECIES: hypothetical protein [unclassified Mameliella]|uniref:hypothetical protein n=1 Tax=unclassified Mameliella TaxID=2630630 RepID=UPI00273DB38F|nr:MULTISPECIES: hypothetical protein [unclassified Mameliella]
MREIKVNEFGVSEDGDKFDLVASPDAVDAGLMVNEPVILIYPDGRRVKTTQAKITKLGLAIAASQMSAGNRH